MPRGRISLLTAASTLTVLALTLAPGMQGSALAQLGDDDPPAAGGAAPAAPASLKSSGAIKFEDENHDFGVVLQSDRPEADYTFVNEGTTELEIVKVTPTCGC